MYDPRYGPTLAWAASSHNRRIVKRLPHRVLCCYIVFMRNEQLHADTHSIFIDGMHPRTACAVRNGCAM